MNPNHWSGKGLPAVSDIGGRLAAIFPEGTNDRAFLVREMAAKTVYVFLYIQAIRQIEQNRLRPNMVTSMGTSQASLVDLSARDAWRIAALGKGGGRSAESWYDVGTREPIRDETIRALRDIGAVEEEPLAATSPQPRYQLALEFADLFDPNLEAAELPMKVLTWQERHLTAGAPTRIELLRRLDPAQGHVQILLPGGQSRSIPNGPSALLAKACVEELLPKIFVKPAVLAMAEGRARLLFEDERLLHFIGLAPDERLMPDLLCADLEWSEGGAPGALLLIAVELVASAGAMTDARLRQICEWLTARGQANTPFVAGTVFADRAGTAARRWSPDVAWGTFVWHAAEPNFISLRLGNPVPGLIHRIVTTPTAVLGQH